MWRCCWELKKKMKGQLEEVQLMEQEQQHQNHLLFRLLLEEDKKNFVKFGATLLVVVLLEEEQLVDSRRIDCLRVEKGLWNRERREVS